MSIAVNELAEIRGERRMEGLRAERNRRAVTERNRRAVSVAVNDFRRPPAGHLEYRSNRVVVDRAAGRLAEDRIEAPGFAVTVAACLLTALVVFGLFGLWNWRTGGPEATPATATVQVQAGESLSDVAARVAPGVPVAEVIGAILDLNDLSGTAVRPGQMLLAPAGYR